MARGVGRPAGRPAPPDVECLGHPIDFCKTGAFRTQVIANQFQCGGNHVADGRGSVQPIVEGNHQPNGADAQNAFGNFTSAGKNAGHASAHVTDGGRNYSSRICRGSNHGRETETVCSSR